MCPSKDEIFPSLLPALKKHFGPAITWQRITNGLYEITISPGQKVRLKLKCSKNHKELSVIKPEVRKLLRHVDYFTFSEADVAGEAAAFLALAQYHENEGPTFVLLPWKKLHELVVAKGGYRMYIDHTKSGYAYSSRGLSAKDRLACAHSREHLRAQFPMRDLTEYILLGK